MLVIPERDILSCRGGFERFKHFFRHVGAVFDCEKNPGQAGPEQHYPRMPVVSGLMCTHADCYALCINLEDSEEHAISTHGGNVAAITCGVYESLCRDESKTTQLYRVLDKGGV